MLKTIKCFFAKIQERLAAKATEESTPDTKIGISIGSNAISSENLRKALASTGRRGDVMIALPMHGNAYVYLDFGNDQFKVGHAAVITRQVTNSTSFDTHFTVGAQTSGVTTESITYWSYQCYIVGLQKIEWVWKWRGFKSGFYKQTTLLNPAPLATWAESFKGRPYVKWYEFLTAKWAAPSRFTCTTLVWWCAKKAYDINVSEWWKTLVTPGGLLTDESVYIRRVVSF